MHARRKRIRRFAAHGHIAGLRKQREYAAIQNQRSDLRAAGFTAQVQRIRSREAAARPQHDRRDDQRQQQPAQHEPQPGMV